MNEKHEWVLGVEAGIRPGSKIADLLVCKKCGLLKSNTKNPESPCRGKVKVTVRAKEKS